MIDTSWMLTRAETDRDRERRNAHLLIAMIILMVLVIATALAAVIFRPAVTGDTNDDGRLNATDLTRMKRHLLGMFDLPRPAIARCDVNGNGRIDQADIDHWIDQILSNQ